MLVRTLFTIREFLRDFLKLKHSLDQQGISDDWKHFFTRDELIEVLNDIYGDDLSKHINIETTPCSKLLIAINDDMFLLEHLLNRVNTCLDIGVGVEISRLSISTVLDQLGLPIHYLREKRIKTFDRYDLSNMENLYRKAGWLKSVYGIYDSMVKQSDIRQVSSHPSLFYDSRSDALEELSRMIVDGECSENERHVLVNTLYVHEAQKLADI